MLIRNFEHKRLCDVCGAENASTYDAIAYKSLLNQVDWYSPITLQSVEIDLCYTCAQKSTSLHMVRHENQNKFEISPIPQRPKED